MTGPLGETGPPVSIMWS